MRQACITMVLALLTSCTITVNGGEDDGEKVTRSFDLTDFNKIKITGTGDVEFTQDSTYSIEVTATESAIEQLRLSVSDSVLEITQKSDKKMVVIIGKNNSYKMKISAPCCRGIHVTGSGSVTAKKPILTDRFSVSVSGAGNINLDKLFADSVGLSINGAGDIGTGEITAQNVRANINGNGNMELKERDVESTRLTINGSGNIKAAFANCGLVSTAINGTGNMEFSGDVQRLEGGSKGVGTSNLKIK